MYTKKNDAPVKPERNIPAKPEPNPDPTKKRPGQEPERTDPTRIKEPPKTDPTRIQPNKPEQEQEKRKQISYFGFFYPKIYA